MTRRRRLHSGGVFLITVGVLASLVAILAATAANEQVTLRAIANRTSARRARLMADSGIQFGLETLSTQTPTGATNQQDDWYQLIGQTGATKYAIGQDYFRVQIIDAGSLINLNTAPEAQLQRLPLTQEQIDSLLDWRETGTTPRVDGGKDEYYNQLAIPYNTKLQSLNTIDELLLVKGFTPKTIYQVQTDIQSTNPLPTKPDGSAYTLYDLSTVDSTSSNAGPTGGALPNIRTVGNANQLTQRGIPQQLAAQIVARRNQITNYAALMRIPGMTTRAAQTLVNSYSVGTGNATTQTGKIDANTASQAALESIPNMTPDIATAIVQQQGTGFAQLGDLFNVSGYTPTVAAGSLDSLSTNSQMFIIRVIGYAGTTKISMEALVSITANGPQILKTTRPPMADMAADWGWDDQTSSDNVLLEATQQ